MKKEFDDNNLSGLIELKASTFEAGFDPCKKLIKMQSVFDTNNITLTKKMHFWKKEFYSGSDFIIAIDEENLLIA